MLRLYTKQPLLIRAWRRRLLIAAFSGASRALDINSKRQKRDFSIKVVSRYPRWECYTMKRWSSSSSSSSSSDNVTWLWEATKGMIDFNRANQHGTRTVFAKFTFNSVTPLDVDHFRQAFKHFMKKVPNMRTVIRPRGDSHWYCQLHNPEIDLEVLTDPVTFNEDCFKLLIFRDSDSLPWKARLIQRAPDTPCQMEGVKKKYPHQCDLMMLYNHTLSDGIDFQPVMTSFCKILDDIVGGRTVKEDSIGIFENNQQIAALLNQRKETLQRNPEKLELIKGSLPSLGDIPTVIQAFPRPQVSEVTTKHVRRFIAPDMLKGLLAKCSANRVTFNSFSIAACNVALLEAMEEAGFFQEVYNIASLMFIDARRYIKSEAHLLGCHVLPLSYTSQVQKKTKDYFWDYCKKVNQDLKSYFGEGVPVLDQAAVIALMEASYPAFNYTDNPRPASHDFSVANLGEITHTLKGDGDFVQMTNLESFNKIHKYRNCLLQEIYTFKGRARYALSYDTSYFTEETTQLFADKIFQVFKTFGK